MHPGKKSYADQTFFLFQTVCKNRTICRQLVLRTALLPSLLPSAFYSYAVLIAVLHPRPLSHADQDFLFHPANLHLADTEFLGYLGLRYIELSISSPICNASGALVAIIAIVSGTAEKMAAAQYIAIFLACAGVIGLGFVEANEDDELRAARQEASNYKYAKSWLALALPIAYCILDAAGTFADDLVLETLNEDSANVAYELTFLAAGIVSFIYTVIIKKQKLLPKAEGPKYIGAAFETAGQLAYIYALASGESALAAPIIASYCMASVLWSRLFLKEKLSWKHYTCILVTFAGILIMGIYDM